METAVFLNRHYPDGLTSLLPLGDLVTLGGHPEACDRMDEDGDYGPARDTEYPPPPWPDWDEAMDLWTAIHMVVDFVARWRRESGWEAVSIGGRPLVAE